MNGELDDLELPERAALPAEPDELLDHLATLAARILTAPTAFVSLVDRTGQKMPGAAGWTGERELPLSHSLCQQVVAFGPLIVSDVAADPRFRDGAVVTDMGVGAYAGIPLRDAEDRPIGSLCVLDHHARGWTEAELRNLIDLAEACEAMVRMRIAAVASAVSAERERIARDLHSEVFGDLLTLSMLLDNARPASPDAGALNAVALSSVRQIMANLGAAVFSPRATA